MALPDISGLEPSHALPVAEGRRTTLGTRLAGRLEAHPGESGVALLRDGRDGFAARAGLAQWAERSIDLQYYLFRYDTVGSLLVGELLEAADRGVRVRMLIDDLYTNLDEDDWVALGAHPEIEIRLFNPFDRTRRRALQYLTRFHAVNHRMHSKSYTVDNQVSILGGRNIAGPFFEDDPELTFTDRDVLIAGPAVQDVEREFDDYWNSRLAYPVAMLVTPGTGQDLAALRNRLAAVRRQTAAAKYLAALDNSPLAAQLRKADIDFSWASCTVVHDTAEKDDPGDASTRLLISQLAPYITSATSEVTIVSPYFVPGRKGAQALCDLATAGVRVRALTNSLASNDVPVVHAGYAKFRKALLRCGVELYELDEDIRHAKEQQFTWLPQLKKSSLHAKSMVFDRATVFVGSFNFDRRSLHINNEIGVVIELAAFGEESARFFDGRVGEVAFRVTLDTDHRGRESLRWSRTTEHGPVVFHDEPHAGMALKAMVAVLRRLPVEAQL